jgi:hypothetical protein
MKTMNPSHGEKKNAKPELPPIETYHEMAMSFAMVVPPRMAGEPIGAYLIFLEFYHHTNCNKVLAAKFRTGPAMIRRLRRRWHWLRRCLRHDPWVDLKLWSN